MGRKGSWVERRCRGLKMIKKPKNLPLISFFSRELEMDEGRRRLARHRVRVGRPPVCLPDGQVPHGPPPAAAAAAPPDPGRAAPAALTPTGTLRGGNTGAGQGRGQAATGYRIFNWRKKSFSNDIFLRFAVTSSELFTNEAADIFEEDPTAHGTGRGSGRKVKVGGENEEEEDSEEEEEEDGEYEDEEEEGEYEEEQEEEDNYDEEEGEEDEEEADEYDDEEKERSTEGRDLEREEEDEEDEEDDLGDEEEEEEYGDEEAEDDYDDYEEEDEEGEGSEELVGDDESLRRAKAGRMKMGKAGESWVKEKPRRKKKGKKKGKKTKSRKKKTKGRKKKKSKKKRKRRRDNSIEQKAADAETVPPPTPDKLKRLAEEAAAKEMNEIADPGIVANAPLIKRNPQKEADAKEDDEKNATEEKDESVEASREVEGEGVKKKRRKKKKENKTARRKKRKAVLNFKHKRAGLRLGRAGPRDYSEITGGDPPFFHFTY